MPQDRQHIQFLRVIAALNEPLPLSTLKELFCTPTDERRYNVPFLMTTERFDRVAATLLQQGSLSRGAAGRINLQDEIRDQYVNDLLNSPDDESVIIYAEIVRAYLIAANEQRKNRQSEEPYILAALRYLCNESGNISDETERILVEYVKNPIQHDLPTLLLKTKYQIGNDNTPCILVKQVGSGGFGTVWLAFDLKMLSWRAVKVLLPDRTDSSNVDRFAREANLLRQISHNNIIRIIDFYRESPSSSGEVHGRLNLITEYLDGQTLTEIIHQHPNGMPLDDISDILRKVAAGLRAVHDNGVIHRDIKPSNIMFDSRGEPKLIDFGLARGQDPPEDQRITQSDRFIGTYLYASPEQIGTETLTPASDQYSLAMVAYEMIVGRLPFAGYSRNRRIIAYINERPIQPAAHTTRPDLVDKPKLSKTLEKAFSIKPADRFNSVEDFIKELCDALTTYDTSTISQVQSPALDGDTVIQGNADQNSISNAKATQVFDNNLSEDNPLISASADADDQQLTNDLLVDPQSFVLDDLIPSIDQMIDVSINPSKPMTDAIRQQNIGRDVVGGNIVIGGNQYQVHFPQSFQRQESQSLKYLAEERRFDAAMPEVVKVGQPTEVRALIAMPYSEGLNALLPDSTQSNKIIYKSDQKHGQMLVTYVLKGNQTKPDPGHLTIRVSADDFYVPNPEKNIMLHLGQDSGQFSFKLTPRVAREKSSVILHATLTLQGKSIYLGAVSPSVKILSRLNLASFRRVFWNVISLPLISDASDVANNLDDDHVGVVKQNNAMEQNPISGSPDSPGHTSQDINFEGDLDNANVNIKGKQTIVQNIYNNSTPKPEDIANTDKDDPPSPSTQDSLRIEITGIASVIVILAILFVLIVTMASTPSSPLNNLIVSFITTDTPTPTDTETVTQTPMPTDTETPIPTNTDTPTPTNTPTITDTETSTPTNTPTVTATDTGTPSPTATYTETPTRTYTPTITISPTSLPPGIVAIEDGDGSQFAIMKAPITYSMFGESDCDANDTDFVSFLCIEEQDAVRYCETAFDNGRVPFNDELIAADEAMNLEHSNYDMVQIRDDGDIGLISWGNNGVAELVRENPDEVGFRAGQISFRCVFQLTR